MSHTEVRSPTLPLELIFRVIESLDTTNMLVLDTRNNAQARSILFFTRVSKATYPIALRILYRRCLWIDSSERLRLLLIALDVHLSPDRHKTSGLPHVEMKDCLQDLLLAPYKRSLDDLPIAHWIFELFARMRHTLRRLMIDIPLRSLYPEDDHLNVRPRLRAAFEELTCLEEFTSINDDLYLSTHEDMWTQNHEIPVWSKWHALKHLALYNIDLDYEDFELLPTLSQLKSLVLVRPDSSGSESWLSLFRKFTNENLTVFEINEYRSSERSSGLHALCQQDRANWGLQCNLDLVPVSVPYVCICGEHLDVIDIVKIWVKERVIDGSIWNKDSLFGAMAWAQAQVLDIDSVPDCRVTLLQGTSSKVNSVV